MKQLNFIGDIHGDFTFHHTITTCLENSIQIGDYGIGFGDNPVMDHPNHRFIRGNHDNYEECKSQYPKSFINDGTVEDTPIGKMMFLGGAFSIDKQWRTPGKDWWHTEEITLEKSYELIKIYKQTKPVIMVTHDLPKSISIELFGHNNIKIEDNITNVTLDEMFMEHKPKYWIAGHWHKSITKIIDNCSFTVIGINDIATINFS
jgi:Icc-related predicted phosphoesterase